jgi:hypothetical protein
MHFDLYVFWLQLFISTFFVEPYGCLRLKQFLFGFLIVVDFSCLFSSNYFNAIWLDLNVIKYCIYVPEIYFSECRWFGGPHHISARPDSVTLQYAVNQIGLLPLCRTGVAQRV